MGKTRKRGHRSEIDDRGIEGKENGAQRNEGKDKSNVLRAESVPLQFDLPNIDSGY